MRKNTFCYNFTGSEKCFSKFFKISACIYIIIQANTKKFSSVDSLEFSKKLNVHSFVTFNLSRYKGHRFKQTEIKSSHIKFLKTFLANYLFRNILRERLMYVASMSDYPKSCFKDNNFYTN